MNFPRQLSVLTASAIVACAVIVMAVYCYKMFVIERYQYEFYKEVIPTKIDKLTGKTHIQVSKSFPGKPCIPRYSHNYAGCEWILLETADLRY